MYDNNEEENNNVRINKMKILTNALTIAIALIITVIVLTCIYIVSKPIILKENTVTTNNGTNSKYVNAIEEAVDMINEKYIDIYDVDEEEMLENVMSSVAASVGDPYTRYITEEEYNEMLVSGTEEYSGIGVHLTYDTDVDAIVIMSVMPGSPALEAGLQIGDYIIKVEDTIVDLKEGR